MKHAETVTFGGSGLDRAAHERKDTHRLWSDPSTRVIVLWKGKPLVTKDRDSLVMVEVGDDILGDAADGYVYLGRNGGAPTFAADISSWSPDDIDETMLNTFLDPSEQVHPAARDGAIFAELRAIMTSLSARDAELAATARAIFGWHDTHRFCSSCGHLSEFKMAGWQRDCPSCGRSHFPRTDPVVIMLIVKDDNVLVGRSPGWPEGMYSLLAGFVEPGETLEAAVRREVKEESGITVGQVSYLASQPWPFPASLMFGCIGEALDEEIVVDAEELEDAMWISRDDMHIVFAGQHPVMKPAREGAIAHFLLDNWLSNTLE